MHQFVNRLTTRIAFVMCCLLVTALPAIAETDSAPDHWEFGGSAYLWAAGVKGTSADVLKELDGGVMGVVAAQKGRWTLIADVIYLSVHQETNTTANLVGIPLKVDTDMKLKGFITTFGAAYRVIEDDKSSLDLLAGARYFKLDVDLGE